MKKFLCIALSLFMLLSCEKSNIDSYQDYIGVWTNVSGSLTRTLDVDADGNSYYEERTKSGNSSSYVKYTGKFILDGTSLKIGFKKLNIDESPVLINGSWYLIMDDLEYLRY